MPTPTTPYPVETRTMGLVDEQEITVVVVPRRDFLGVVDRTLTEYVANEAVRADVRATAERMETFPFRTFLHPTRGCGCVVGEFLIARRQLDRIALTEQARADMRFNPVAEGFPGSLSSDTVERLLTEELGNDAEDVFLFGNEVDADLAATFVRSDLRHEVDALVITDPTTEGAPT